MTEAAPPAAAPKPATAIEISVRLPKIDELFVSFDPSPLVERDIDNAIEEYIVDSAIDAPRGSRFKLTIHLPVDAQSGEDAVVVAKSVRNYFAYMRDREALRVRRLLREGRSALLVGFLFLAACVAMGQALIAVEKGAFASVIREGLIIIGWVANWRPIEIFLYDWRPLARRRQVYAALAELEVEVKSG
ncbi:MAG: hypothetical protein WD076_05860 [Parvularculaceae bacterium]